ncbi:hypothetical protein [Ruminococcus sp.]|uniref:hypothetical protein n=1 Tax=Ruminococcus sp. TaxID=41978 RepID=UPI001B53D2F3|nr:hypothetical protein [Ruminococcus sp.]MBP5432747.1 hypothetical protein [Ruminococcus sp.]
MKDNEKNNISENDIDEKLDIEKSVFLTAKELNKLREEENERKQQEIERQYAQHEKEKREAYEKKIHDERIELMRLKQGLISEEESAIHEEKEEEIKLTLGKKIGNFFYHNKWWLGLGTFFVVLAIFLIADILRTPRPDMTVLMLCQNNDVGGSVFLEDFFTEFTEDFNGNGKVLASVYYIPYSSNEYDNYTSGASVKLTTYLNSAEAVIIIGNKQTTEELLVPDQTLTDLSSIYPDDPHVKDWFYYLKGTNFAQKIGVPEDCITDDMFLAIRKPIKLVNDSKEEMQETYDKDFPVFDSIVKSLSAGK